MITFVNLGTSIDHIHDIQQQFIDLLFTNTNQFKNHMINFVSQFKLTRAIIVEPEH
jgi:hypothetical protein